MTQMTQMTNDEIKALMLANGFSIKEGLTEYTNGLRDGRKQEQDRILRIVYDECIACGAVGEQAWINIKSKVRNPLKTESDK